MNKRKRPSAWDIAKLAGIARVPWSKGGRGGSTQAWKKQKVIPGFTRTGGAFARALNGRPGVKTLGGQIEKKYLDTAIGYSTAAIAGAVNATAILAIAQGTTEVTRVGGKINVCNINIRGQVRGLGATATPGAFRWILFVDKQCNGAAPAVTDILTTATINSFLNMDNVERFQILKDKMVINNVSGVYTTTPVYFAETKMIKAAVKCNIPIHYSSTTGAIAEIKSNNIGMLFISEKASSVEYGVTVRVKFTDA